jgi:hypothetical protein
MSFQPTAVYMYRYSALPRLLRNSAFHFTLIQLAAAQRRHFKYAARSFHRLWKHAFFVFDTSFFAVSCIFCQFVAAAAAASARVCHRQNSKPAAQVSDLSAAWPRLIVGMHSPTLDQVLDQWVPNHLFSPSLRSLSFQSCAFRDTMFATTARCSSTLTLPRAARMFWAFNAPPSQGRSNLLQF